MENILVVSKKILSVVVLLFIVVFILSGVSSKPVHALIVPPPGGGGGSGGGGSVGYWECSNIPSNGQGCFGSGQQSSNVTSGSVGINVIAVSVTPSGTEQRYNGVGISVRSESPSGFGGSDSLGQGWGPKWNYWVTSSNSCLPSGSRCWTFVNGNYSILQGITDRYPVPYLYPTGAANPSYYSASGTTDNGNGTWVLSQNGLLDCGFGPFTFTVTPPPGSTGVSTYYSTSPSGPWTLTGGASTSNYHFQNGQTYYFHSYVDIPNPNTNPNPNPTQICSISVSASPSSPTVGSNTTLSITEKLNGVLAPNGDTLDISSNAGSVSTSSAVYSESPTNVSENDPSSSPNTLVTFTVKSTKYTNCSGSTTVSWSGMICIPGSSTPGCEPPIQPVCVGGTIGSYGGSLGTVQRNYKQLVINGSLIGYNGIYDYRDLGGCDPFYPAVKILYNLKYISLYNINFLKLIGNNLEIWQEEGI